MMSTPRDFRYSDAGVSRRLGDECSEIAYKACLETFANREGGFDQPLTWEGGFTNPVQISDLTPGSCLVKNSDGVGSKALVAQRMDKYDTLGYDLIAMNADDSACIGAEPFVGTNTLDISKAEPNLVADLMKGLVEACNEARMAIVGGEVAEIPHQLKGYNNPFIWNADVLGIVNRDKIIDGSEISPGHRIVAIKSNGIRSNGLTLAREICSANFGKSWHEAKLDQASWGELLLQPSLICTPGLLDLVGRYGEKSTASISGIVHISGGGMSNLNRILPRGTGAVLDDLFSPQQVFLELQRIGPVSDEEAYLTWNMGQCSLVITPEPDRVVTKLEGRGFESRVVGSITDEERIVIDGKGHEGKEVVI